MYIPTCLRPAPGVRVEIDQDYTRDEITVRFYHQSEILHEHTYLAMAWTVHAYNHELHRALERLEFLCPDDEPSEESKPRERNRPNPRRRREAKNRKYQ